MTLRKDILPRNSWILTLTSAAMLSLASMQVLPAYADPPDTASPDIPTAASASLTGTVLNGESLTPIANATITIFTSDQQVQTEINGQFSLAKLPVGNIELQISASGFSPSTEFLDLGVDGIRDQVFVLLRQGLTTETIEIRETTRAPQAPGKQKLTRRELTRIAGARGDALTSLKSLPGVGGADAVGAGPGLLVIRGSAPEDSVILLDGIEVPLVYHFGGLQSILPSEFIETIDFSPGGFGADKGRSTGGVIEINTRNKAIEQWTGFAELSFINFAGLVQGPLGKMLGKKLGQDIQLTAAIRRSAIDLVLPLAIPDDSSIQFTTAPVYYDGQLRVDWFPKTNHRVSFFGLASLDLLTLLAEMPDPNEPLLTGKFENQTDFTRAITTWAFEDERVSNRLVTSLGTGGFRFEIGAQRFLRITNRALEVRNDTRFAYNQRLQLRAGVSARYSRGRLETKIPLPPGEGQGAQDNFSTRPVVELDKTYTDNVAASYLAADLTSYQGLTISPSLRVDYYGRQGQATLGPRLAVRYRPPRRKVDRAACSWQLHSATSTSRSLPKRARSRSCDSIRCRCPIPTGQRYRGIVLGLLYRPQQTGRPRSEPQPNGPKQRLCEPGNRSFLWR